MAGKGARMPSSARFCPLTTRLRASALYELALYVRGGIGSWILDLPKGVLFRRQTRVRRPRRWRLISRRIGSHDRIARNALGQEPVQFSETPQHPEQQQKRHRDVQSPW